MELNPRITRETLRRIGFQRLLSFQEAGPERLIREIRIVESQFHQRNWEDTIEITVEDWYGLVNQFLDAERVRMSRYNLRGRGPEIVIRQEIIDEEYERVLRRHHEDEAERERMNERNRNRPILVEQIDEEYEEIIRRYEQEQEAERIRQAEAERIRQVERRLRRTRGEFQLYRLQELVRLGRIPDNEVSRRRIQQLADQL